MKLIIVGGLICGIIMIAISVYGIHSMNYRNNVSDNILKEVRVHQSYIIIKVDSVLKYKCKEHTEC